MIDEMTYSSFLDRYRDKSYIGSGGFAKVYKVYDFANRKYVVVKVANVRPELKKFTLQNEVELVNQLPPHPNIIRYEACYRFNTGIAGEMDFAVLPFYEYGNLEQFLESTSPSFLEKKRIVLGILEGVRFLHQKNCIHRDLKAQNILVHKEGDRVVAKIADFGLSRYVNSYDSGISNSSIGLTFEYASPEQIKNQKIYKNVDIWAVGVLIYKIITGKSLFMIDQEVVNHDVHAQLEVSKRIVNRILPANFHSLPQPYKSLIDCCLVVDPKQRIQSADELIHILNKSTEEILSLKPKSLLQNQRLEPNSAPSNYSFPVTDSEGQTKVIHASAGNSTAWPLKREYDDSISRKPDYKTNNEPVEYLPQAPDTESSKDALDPAFSQKKEIKLAKKMNASSDKINKAWIYIPSYVFFLVLSCWALFSFLNSNEPSEEVEVNPPLHKESPSSMPQDFIACFEEGRRAVGGTFALIPTKEFMTTFEQMNTACFAKICAAMNAIASGDNPSQIFYRKAIDGDECFEPLYNKSLAYHNRQLENLSVLSLFYDSGQYMLSDRQKLNLDGFIKGYKKSTDDFGLLIIGRASNKGDKLENKNLSERRGQTIIEFIEQKNIKGLKIFFAYFGADPPQLDQDIAEQYGIQEQEYRNITYGGGNDPKFNLRLNQSVLLVFYPRSEDPFGLEE